MVAVNYNIDNPRITATLALTAATVLSLKDFIINVLTTNAVASVLFANQIVANSAARLALTGIDPGYIVYQTSGTAFYEFIGTDPSVAGDWRLQSLAELRSLQSFLKNISWRVKQDSSIGNAGTNPTYVMNGWMNDQSGATPSATAMTTYGIPLPAGAERTFSGHSKHYYLYSASGTNIALDLIFEV